MWSSFSSGSSLWRSTKKSLDDFVVSLVANNSWQAFPKMVPRPRNSCNTIQHSTYPPSYGHCHRAGWQAAGGPASLCAGCAPSPSLWTCLNYVVRVSWFWCANFGNECYDLVATRETTLMAKRHIIVVAGSKPLGWTPFDLFAARFLAICTRH